MSSKKILFYYKIFVKYVYNFTTVPLFIFFFFSFAIIVSKNKMNN